jgi:predicted integral membrane protein DUF2270
MKSRRPASDDQPRFVPSRGTHPQHGAQRAGSDRTAKTATGPPFRARNSFDGSLQLSSESASPLPLVLVGLLVATFLYIEARRYRFFDFWRMRAHVFEVYFFGPILRGHGVQVENGWNEILYQDYRAPNLHITYAEAVGRRLRHNYSWIFAIQVTRDRWCIQIFSFWSGTSIRPRPRMMEKASAK